MIGQQRRHPLRRTSTQNHITTRRCAPAATHDRSFRRAQEQVQNFLKKVWPPLDEEQGHPLITQHNCAGGTVTGTAGSTAPVSGVSTTFADANGHIDVSSEGGVSVLDGKSLELVKTFDSEDFTRLNAAGDGRHIFVTTTGSFQLLDTAEPKLTDLVVEATAQGHVVRHPGNTVLFDDGTGTTTILKSEDLARISGALPRDSDVHG